mmetsp:Transcript_49720/g.129608  ORF Transcript_49720/g.129608 Transcript_49720/m.129608 type:complete len:86 (-) Transcript_49720:126-383(-)
MMEVLGLDVNVGGAADSQWRTVRRRGAWGARGEDAWIRVSGQGETLSMHSSCAGVCRRAGRRQLCTCTCARISCVPQHATVCHWR